MTEIVVCHACGQQNRMLVPVPPGQVAICGRCKVPLVDGDDAEDDDSDEEEAE